MTEASVTPKAILGARETDRSETWLEYWGVSRQRQQTWAQC